MPVTWNVALPVIALLRSRTRPTARSRPHQPGDRVRRLTDLDVGGLTALGDSLCDAMPQVLFEQAERDRLEGTGGRRHLGKDVDAVLVFLDHALQPAHLALDPPQATQVVRLVFGISAHAASPRVPGQHTIPPSGIQASCTWASRCEDVQAG